MFDMKLFDKGTLKRIVYLAGRTAMVHDGEYFIFDSEEGIYHLRIKMVSSALFANTKSFFQRKGLFIRSL